MTTLLERCRSLDAKLKEFTLAKRHANDLKHIQQRTGEWSVRNTKLKALRKQTAPLTLAVEDAKALDPKRTTLRQNASKVLARLKEDEDITGLTRDAAWARLLGAADGLAQELETAGRKAWRAYLEHEGELEDPATLRLRTPATPQNSEALRAYEDSHAAYSAIARLLLPKTAEDVTKLSTYVSASRQALSRLTFDLPPEVMAFYKSIYANSATLANVTPRVLQWLTDQGQLERFRVRSASQ